MKSHIVRAIAIAMLLFGITGAPSVRAQQRGPSTSEERSKAVKIAHDLEDDPLAKDAKAQREWVIQWIVDIPDITVNVCFDYFGKLPDPPRGHSTEIARQMVISSAAFMIEHPEKAKDEQTIALSGLLGSLKAYQSILKQDPTARWAQMDKLIQMRDQGKLDDYVTDTRRKCSQDQEEPDPDTIRADAR
ncbi:MAG: hypothetical protein ABSA96_06725 [Candidatus Acidiferrales bacterium]|jgi:hypothetical protein